MNNFKTWDEVKEEFKQISPENRQRIEISEIRSSGIISIINELHRKDITLEEFAKDLKMKRSRLEKILSLDIDITLSEEAKILQRLRLVKEIKPESESRTGRDLINELNNEALADFMVVEVPRIGRESTSSLGGVINFLNQEIAND